MDAEPRWLTRKELRYLHYHQISSFGGTHGERDVNLIESALAAPRQRFHYEDTDLLALAVALCAAIVRNHPFVDGNKRTALAAMLTFLRFNGYDLDAPDDLSLGYLIERLITREIDTDTIALAIAPYLRPA